MDLDSIEGLNEVRPSVYRTAMKLRSLQKHCHMHVVTLRELVPALRSLGGASHPGAGLSKQEVMQGISRMFQIVEQEVPGQVSAEAPEQTCRLLYRLYDRGQTDTICRRSVEAALIALSADTLSAKYRALVGLAERCSGREGGMVSRSGLRVLLQDLSQVPAVVQESHVFGSAETAVRSCFSGVLSASVCEEHVLSWLQCEPCLLLWLSTLYRLSVSESVTHSVRCHACKTYPITGLRYRCMKCVNIHLCQTCFLTERHTKKHKSSHPVLEHCSQPSWRESLASLAYSIRHTVLPRRCTRRKAERRGLIKAETQGESHPSFITSDPLHQSEASPAPSDVPPTDIETSISLPQSLATPLAVMMRKTSKALQTETPPQRRDSVFLNDIRDLQRDKWLLERQLQVWRVAVQSEQGHLEDRCCEMEANMETLRQHNLRLQDLLSKAVGISGTHTDVVPHEAVSSGKTTAERDTGSPLSYPSSESFSKSTNEKRKEKEEEECDDEDSRENEETYLEKMHRVEFKRSEQRVMDDEEELTMTGSAKETHTPTMHWRVTSNLHTCDGENFMLDGHVRGPIKDQPVSEEKHSGVCSLVEEEKLCELAQQLKSKLFLNIHTHTGCRQEPGLLEAAEEVGDSVRDLVAAVKSHADPHSDTHTVSKSCYKDDPENVSRGITNPMTTYDASYRT